MVPEQPVVSVVIPAYNHAQYLGEAIQSVLTQDYPRLELIVLDDGSTDGTRDVLAKYSRHFRHFSWVSHPHMGQANTLNKGWRLAKGEILGYLGADDVLLRGAVNASVECLSANPDGVATYCDFNLIDPQSRVVRRVRTPEFDYRKMLVDVTCLPGPGAFFRRDAYQKVGLWDPSLQQMPDYEFWLRLGLHGRLQRIPMVLAGFRVHAASQSFASTSKERADEPVRIVGRLLKRTDLPEKVRGLEAAAMSKAHLVSAQLHLRSGRYRLALQRIRESWELDPARVISVESLRLLVNALGNRAGHRALWAVRGTFGMCKNR